MRKYRIGDPVSFVYLGERHHARYRGKVTVPGIGPCVLLSHGLGPVKERELRGSSEELLEDYRARLRVLGATW